MLRTPAGRMSAAISAMPQGGERRDLGRLEHDRVAGRERGRDLPRRHHQRVVPRRDLADDADRLAPDHRRSTRARTRPAAWPSGRAGRAGHEAQAVRRAGHLFDGGAARLADVQGLELAELLGVLVERVGELVQDLEPLGRGGVAPVAEEGPLGRLDGVVDVLGGRTRDGGDHLAGRGVAPHRWSLPSSNPRPCRRCGSKIASAQRSCPALPVASTPILSPAIG